MARSTSRPRDRGPAGEYGHSRRRGASSGLPSQVSRRATAGTWGALAAEDPRKPGAHQRQGRGFITAGARSTPGGCRPRRASGCWVRPWTGLRRPPRWCADTDSAVCQGGRPPPHGSAGDSSLGARLFSPGQSGVMLPLQRSVVNLCQGGRTPANPIYCGATMFSLLYYIRALLSLTHTHHAWNTGICRDVAVNRACNRQEHGVCFTCHYFGYRYPRRAWGGGVQVGSSEGMAGSAPGQDVFFPN